MIAGVMLSNVGGLLITTSVVLWILRRFLGCGLVLVRPFDEACVSNRLWHATRMLSGGYHWVWPWEHVLSMELLGVRGRTEYARITLAHPIVVLLPSVLCKTDDGTTPAQFRVDYALRTAGKVSLADRLVALPRGQSIRQLTEDEIRDHIGSLNADDAKQDTIDGETSLVMFRARRVIQMQWPPPTTRKPQARFGKRADPPSFDSVDEDDD